MKFFAICTTAAVLLLGTPIVAESKDLDTSSLQALKSHADKAFTSICAAERAPDVDAKFEAEISEHVRGFVQLFYQAMETESYGADAEEGKDKNTEKEEEEKEEGSFVVGDGELKKRGYRQRPQTLGRESIYITKLRARPCNNLYHELYSFSKTFKQLM